MSNQSLSMTERMLNKERQTEALATVTAMLDAATAIAVLHSVAEATHAEFPQYNTHWKGWRLARCVWQMDLKHGRVFAKPGDYLLVAPNVRVEIGLPETVSVFSLRTLGDAAWTRSRDYEILL